VQSWNSQNGLSDNMSGSQNSMSMNAKAVDHVESTDMQIMTFLMSFAFAATLGCG